MRNTPRRESNKRSRGYIENYNPQSKTIELLAQVKEVLAEYRKYWPLTCRQIFYRMVGAYNFDKTELAYKRLCEHLANARRGRYIPFEAIRDDGTSTYSLGHFDSHDDFLRHVRELGEGYTRNKLAEQDFHIEVWCEAAGMLPQLFSVAEQYSVPVYSSGGFDSLTSKKQLADRICEIEKKTVILHLGDYDPSGVSIFDAVAEDVTAFVNKDRRHGLIDVRFKRVGLTAGQVRAFELPTAPPKKTDSRAASWRGETCQLEALPPDMIATLLSDKISQYIDFEKFNEDIEAEQKERVLINNLLPAYQVL